MTNAYIHSYGSYQAEGGDDLEPLKQHVIDATGKHVRRIGRFIQAALIGAGRCADGRELPPETAVYLTSGRGDLEVTVDVMEKLFRDGSAPRPLNFINTVSNSACFYVARQLGLRGPSMFSCNKYFSFETALQLALLDFQRGAVTSALIGSTDIVAPPTRVHRLRLGFTSDRTVGEGSHWYYLSAEPSGALGQMERAIFFANHETIAQDIANLIGDPADTAISFGQFMGADLGEALAAQLSLPEVSYHNDWPFYDSQSGGAVGAFLSGAHSYKRLVHVDCDTSGRYGVMVARKA